MSKIKILSDDISNKIAAGEVVERPASILKELVENSIDAKSTRIDIEIQGGGKQLIKVSDNGFGMSKDDTLLSIERHATSKIKSETDLFAIKSLGFRGEALPSIASVSHFFLTSKDEKSQTGTKIEILGGKIKKVEELAFPQGTTIEVRNLFFNTPARKKFLKSMEIENGRIIDLFYKLALIWPNVAFNFTSNNRFVKKLAKVDDYALRIYGLLGKEFKNNSFSNSFEGEKIKIKAFMSTPNLTRSSSQRIYTYVNQRLVTDSGLVASIREGYKGKILKNRYPIFVLFIDILPEDVDVNVHPSKSEVKFKDAQTIYKSLKGLIKQSLFEIERKKLEEIYEKKNKDENKSFISYSNNTENLFISEKERSSGFIKKPQSILENENIYNALAAESEKLNLKDNDSNISYKTESEEEIKNDKISEEKDVIFSQEEKRKFFQKLQVIGQFQKTYIFCQADTDLIIIDQHAAHEKIIYEKLKNNYLKNKISKQTLLFPEMVELSFEEAKRLATILPNLLEIGFNIENFGDNAFIIKEVPAILGDLKFGEIIKEIIEKEIESKNDAALDLIFEDIFASISCHTATRAKDKLSENEINKLLEELDYCQSPSFCPHGRPVFIKLSENFFRKSFKRI